MSTANRVNLEAVASAVAAVPPLERIVAEFADWFSERNVEATGDWRAAVEDAEHQLADLAAAVAAAQARAEQPVAWAVYDGAVREYVHTVKRACDDWVQYKPSRQVVPLYRAPVAQGWQPIREAIADYLRVIDDPISEGGIRLEDMQRVRSGLRNALAILSEPPAKTGDKT